MKAVTAFRFSSIGRPEGACFTEVELLDESR